MVMVMTSSRQRITPTLIGITAMGTVRHNVANWFALHIYVSLGDAIVAPLNNRWLIQQQQQQQHLFVAGGFCQP